MTSLRSIIIIIIITFPGMAKYIHYAIRRVQVNQDGLKLNGTHQLLVYADDVNILGRNVHTVKENAEALVVVTKEIGLRVNADRSRYSHVSRSECWKEPHYEDWL